MRCSYGIGDIFPGTALLGAAPLLLGPVTVFRLRIA